MSIDKIGNMDQNISMQRPVAHRVPKPTTAAESDAVAGAPEGSGSLTRISYPPFFPIGYTQMIYKK